MRVISAFQLFRADRDSPILQAEMNGWSEKQERELRGFRVIGITTFEKSGPTVVVAYEWRDPRDP